MAAVTQQTLLQHPLLEPMDQFRKACDRVGEAITEAIIFIQVSRQRLDLFERGILHCSFAVSTAKNGIGQEEGTGRTPLGLHKVREKIGEGAAPFAVFKSRELTGEIAVPEKGGTSIVGRILRIDGLEPGFNRGKNLEGTSVDTYERYIYIHGTNDVENIGTAISAGCVRMRPEDVIDLFHRVVKGTLVYICA